MRDNVQTVSPVEFVEADPITKSFPQTRNGALRWLKENKTPLILTGISVGAIIGIVLGIKNKEVIAELWPTLSKNTGALPAGSSISMPATIDRAVLESLPPTRAYTLPTRPFDVSRHIRTMKKTRHHSAQKAAEATALGIELLPNQTLVNAYPKGAA